MEYNYITITITLIYFFKNFKSSFPNSDLETVLAICSTPHTPQLPFEVIIIESRFMNNLHLADRVMFTPSGLAPSGPFAGDP